MRRFRGWFGLACRSAALCVLGAAAGRAAGQTVTTDLWATATQTPADNGWDYEEQALGPVDCGGCVDGPFGCSARGREDYPINGDLKLQTLRTSGGSAYSLTAGHRVTHVYLRPTAKYQSVPQDQSTGRMIARVVTTGVGVDRRLDITTTCGSQQEDDVVGLTSWTQSKVRAMEVWLSRPTVNDDRGHLLVDAFRVRVVSECTLNPLGGITVSSPEPCEGSGVTLTAPAYDAEGAVTVTWYKVGVGPVGTGPTYTIASASLADSGCYSCELTNPCKTVAIPQACIRVVPVTRVGPLATPAPLCEGDAYSLCADATGENLTYQWFRDGQPAGTDRCQPVWTGAESFSSYFCRVTGRCSTADTNPVTAVVRPATRVHGASGGGTFCEGDAIQLCVNATGSGLSYQWSKDGAPIPNATSSCFAPTSAPGSSGVYRCTVTGACRIVDSPDVPVVVRARARVQQSPPAALAASSGASFQLCVSATGAGPLSFRWFKDGAALSDGGAIQGARSACLSVNPSRYADRGSYTCRVDGACGFAISSPCVVTVTCAAPPVVVDQPAGGTFGAGREVQLCVTATGTPNLRYQWYRGETPLAEDPPRVTGTQTPCLTFQPLCILDEGFYRCRVWNDCDQQTDSRVARVRVECLADFNDDSFVDFFDYDDYVNCFEGGSCPAGKDADYNGDGFIDFFDYDLFVRQFEFGCCR